MINADLCPHDGAMTWLRHAYCGTEGCRGATTERCETCGWIITTCACGCSNDEQPPEDHRE